jgi:hypothetical protein
VTACQCSDPTQADEAFKPVADSLPVRIDLWDYCAVKRQPNTRYTDGDIVHPDPPNGFALEAQNDGATGEEPPAFMARIGALAWDGAVRWELVALESGGFNPASDPTYEVDPVDSGTLDVADLVITADRYLEFTYIGGQVGERYKVTFSFTVDGVERALAQWVTIT